MSGDPTAVRQILPAQPAPSEAPEAAAPTAGPRLLSGGRLNDAMNAALDAQAQADGKKHSMAVAGAAAQRPTDVGGVDARAHMALQLGAAAPGAAPVAQGDTILKGLLSLRSVFNKNIDDFAGASKNVQSVGSLYELQKSSAEYSVLMDVSTKLIGKGSQAINGLLKGS
jgi:hypothetical protein